MLIGQAGHAAAAGGAGQHTHLHQVGFAHIFQCYTFLTKVGRQGIQAHRTAAVQLNDGTQHAAVQFIQAQLVNIHLAAGCHSSGAVDCPIALHGGKVTHALEQAVCNTRGAAGAFGQLQRTGAIDGDIQNARAAHDDGSQFIRAVGFQLEQNAKAVTQGPGQLARAGGCAHQGEPRQVDADALGAGALADHDIQRVILQCGVQHFFYLAGKAMDLINEQDITLLQIGQQSGKIAGLFDGRAGGNADLHAHLLRHNAGQRCLAKARRAVQQNMVHRFPALLGGTQVNAQIVFGLFLTDIIIQRFGAQADFLGGIGRGGVRADQAAGIHRIFRILAHSGHSFTHAKARAVQF